MLVTCEQVSKYHPDKYADQISDAILDACMKQDKHCKVACECMVKGTTVVIAGEITTIAKVDYNAVVKRVAKKLGYKVDTIINLIGEQSYQINKAVETNRGTAAGDQGIMFGYATDETESMLPTGFDLANRIIKRIEHDAEKTRIFQGDAKCQVTEETDDHSIKQVLVSVCHNMGSVFDIRKYVHNLLRGLIPEGATLIVNPAGAWTIGGPTADCGLTGRKIVCDQYGGYCPVGGGAFSGKDPSKVDRSAAYMARTIACMVVDTFTNVHACEVQLSYAIGVAEPFSVRVVLNNGQDAGLDYGEIYHMIEDFDLTPDGIIDKLGLHDTNYEVLAEGCHYFKEDNEKLVSPMDGIESRR